MTVKRGGEPIHVQFRHRIGERDYPAWYALAGGIITVGCSDLVPRSKHAPRGDPEGYARRMLEDMVRAQPPR
jgi:hypothetical protein